MSVWFYTEFALHWSMIDIIIIANEFYGNIFEKGNFDKILLGNLESHGSNTSDTIGNINRYNAGQYSFTKATPTSH